MPRGKKTGRKGNRATKTPEYSEEAQQIIDLHGKIVDRDKSSLADAIEAGRVLLKVKKCLKRGLFQKWCVANVRSVGARMIRYYIQLHKADREGKLKNAKTLSDAIQMVCRKKVADTAEAGTPKTGTGSLSPENGTKAEAGLKDKNPAFGGAQPSATPAPKEVGVSGRWPVRRTTKARSRAVAEIPDEGVVLEVFYNDAKDLRCAIQEAFQSYADELSTKGRFLIAGTQAPKVSGTNPL